MRDMSIRQAKEQQPDLIIFTGDYIQERLARTGARAAQKFTALLRSEGLQAPLGAFAVSGDVDHDGWERMFDGTGDTAGQPGDTDRAAGRPAPLTDRPRRGRELGKRCQEDRTPHRHGAAG